MPSGYPYLLQLIAHNIVASSLSFAVADGELAVKNARVEPMLLETINGNGPDVGQPFSPRKEATGLRRRVARRLRSRRRAQISPLLFGYQSTRCEPKNQEKDQPHRHQAHMRGAFDQVHTNWVIGRQA